MVAFLFRLAAFFVFRWKPHWKGVDRWTGALAGAVQGVAISAVLLFGLVVLDPIAKEFEARSRNGPSMGMLDQFPRKVADFTEGARASAIGTLMEKMDPAGQRYNQRVQKMAKSITVNMHKDAPFEEKMNEILQEFRGDPQAQRVLSERSGIDRKTLRRILHSPEMDRAIRDGRALRALRGE